MNERIQEPNMIINGEVHHRIAYGSEDGIGDIAKQQNCHDCDVEVGEIHDLGCDVEQCASCSRQLISCNCKWNEASL